MSYDNTPVDIDSFDDTEKTDRHLVICPECMRQITPIRACRPMPLEECMKFTSSCVDAAGIWRWCGTYGSLHVEVFRAIELINGSSNGTKP